MASRFQIGDRVRRQEMSTATEAFLWCLAADRYAEVVEVSPYFRVRFLAPSPPMTPPLGWQYPRHAEGIFTSASSQWDLVEARIEEIEEPAWVGDIP